MSNTKFQDKGLPLVYVIIFLLSNNFLRQKEKRLWRL
jgi:hypothetical protein